MKHETKSWTFLSNHAHVLLLLGNHPDLRIRDVSDKVGITERAVQRIVGELAHGGYLEITKEGRRNHYNVRTEQLLRHSVERGATVADLLKLMD